jgi:pyruvate dehydrogenase E2 component (dihydrolipoamide acetyltransferase)
VLEADLRGLFLSTMRPLEAQQVPAREQITAGIEPGIRTIPRPVEVPPGGRRLSTMRETIAKRLRESLSSTAQYTLHTSANAGQLLAMRRRLKAGGDTADITINDLVVFCTVQALLEVPELNAEFAEGTLYPHSDVHMAFACDTPRGLVVPVVRHSQDLSLRGLSRSMKDLAAKAVGGTIALDDLTGGTFTVSNLGSLGIEFFTPVINPLQVAILGVDAIQLKPVRKPDGNIEFIDAIGLSLTIDHQVIDGAPGARFLRTLTRKIETVETLCTT